MEVKQERQTEERRSDGESARGLGIGLTVAYAIIGTPLLGFGIGYLIDGNSTVKTWSGILGMIGAFAGVGYCVYILNRTQQ
jgi:F0F1-type ATP synthase assembly protein I